jgi:hypothetical protein
MDCQVSSWHLAEEAEGHASRLLLAVQQTCWKNFLIPKILPTSCRMGPKPPD